MAGQRQLAVTELLTREADSATRIVDLQLAIYVGDDIYPLLRVGGRWDREEHAFTGDAESEAELRLHEGQRAAAEFLAEWYTRHARSRALRAEGWIQTEAAREAWDGRDPVYRLMLYGGRRGGKSFLGVVGGVIMAFLVPGARVYMASPAQKDTEELRLAIEVCVPAEWRTFKESEHRFVLPNGSTIDLITGAKRTMKFGRVDYGLYNEAQSMGKAGLDALQGSTTDVSGLVVACFNPPDTVKGQWLQDWYHDYQKGRRRSDKAFFLNPEDNPYIDYGALMTLRDSLSELEYRREVLGDMSAPIGNVVFTAWSDSCVLEYIPSGWRDVTEDVAARWYGGRRALQIAGDDFDANAGCSWIAARYYLQPGDVHIEDAVLVIIGVRDRLYGREEEQVATMLAARDRFGYELLPPESTVVVADASGAFQDAEHNKKAPPSWATLRGAGYHVIPPDPKEDRNPRRDERYALANHLMREARDLGARRRVYFLADAERAIEAARKYPRRNDGSPPKRHEFAHVNDCWTYIAWRRWGRDEDVGQEIEKVFAPIPLPDRAKMGDQLALADW